MKFIKVGLCALIGGTLLCEILLTVTGIEGLEGAVAVAFSYAVATVIGLRIFRDDLAKKPIEAAPDILRRRRWAKGALICSFLWILALIYDSASRADLAAEIVTLMGGLCVAVLFLALYVVLRNAHPWVSVALAGATSGFILIFLAFVHLEPFRHDAVSFESQACAQPDGRDAPIRTLAITWEGDTLVIKGHVCVNCGKSVEAVTAQVLGGNIWLRPRYTARGHAMCNCARSIAVRLDSLQKRDYDVHGLPKFRYCV